jgi:2-dehydropantoate 2-reductase
MRIAVMGAGGVGGYFGAQFAKAGHEVAFIARGRHLAALRESGLMVESAVGAAQLKPVIATDDPSTLAPADVVMFCTKLWDVEASARQVAPLLQDGGVVIPFQNGIESHEILQRVLGAERVAGGVAHIGARIKAPGVIEHIGTLARLRVGAFAGASQDTQARVQAFVAAGRAAQVDIDLAPDITRTLWEKFVFLVALSGVTTVARQPAGVVRSDPDLRAMLLASMDEVAALARARGIALDDAFVQQQMSVIDKLPEAMRSSMLNDLTQGNRLEAPWLAGTVARLSREHGLQAPVNATIYAALKPYIAGK